MLRYVTRDARAEKAEAYFPTENEFITRFTTMLHTREPRERPPTHEVLGLPIPSGLCIVTSGKGGMGKSALVRAAVAQKKAPMVMWAEPPNFHDVGTSFTRIGPTVLALAEAVRQWQESRNDIIIVDSLSELLIQGGQLAAGGLSRTVASILKGLSLSLWQAGRLMIATLNMKTSAEHVYNEMLSELWGDVTSIIEVDKYLNEQRFKVKFSTRDESRTLNKEQIVQWK
jgi:hypothetical protein